MKVNYNAILVAYESTQAEFMADLNESFEIATEASTEEMVAGTSTGNQTQTNNNDTPTGLSPAAKSKFIQTIKKVIEKIGNLIERAKVHINNKLKLLWETDRGFIRRLEKAKAQRQPLKGFNAIIYQYNEGYLDSIMMKAMNAFKKELRALQNPSGMDIEDVDTSEIMERTLKQISNSNDVTDIQSLIHEMIQNYRGEKKEVTMNASQVPALTTVVERGAGNNAFQNYIDDLEQMYSNLKSQTSKLTRASTNEDIRKLTRRMSAATQLYNGALAINKIYYELKVERYLSAREALRQFYAL